MKLKDEIKILYWKAKNLFYYKPWMIWNRLIYDIKFLISRNK